MTRAATLRDVARRAGVASPTASRVLNDDPTVHVRDDTRQRILQAAQELGYVPNSVARSLRGSRTGSVGLIMHDLDSPINTAVLRGAQTRCADAGYVTLLADAEDLAADHSRLRTLLARGRLDGVILQTGYGPGDRLVEQVASTLPAVLVNSKRSTSAPSVFLDDAAAGALATEHLVTLGHDDIAFIGGPTGSPSSSRREDGYRRVMAEHGLRASVVPAGWTAPAGIDAGASVLLRKRRPTGLVVANAITAAGAMSALRDAHVDVPGDMSVVAVHDAWFVALLPAALTTVRMPLFDLGFVAAGMLIDRLDGKHGVADTFIDDPPPELVIRHSTAPASR